MFARKLRMVLIVYSALVLAGMVTAAAQSPRAAVRPAPTAGRGIEAGLSQSGKLIYNYVKMHKPNELAWQRIPWMVDLPAAIKQAAVEHRPLLIFLASDDPLQMC
jgi:hypothetical protein